MRGEDGMWGRPLSAAAFSRLPHVLIHVIEMTEYNNELDDGVGDCFDAIGLRNRMRNPEPGWLGNVLRLGDLRLIGCRKRKG